MNSSCLLSAGKSGLERIICIFPSPLTLTSSTAAATSNVPMLAVKLTCNNTGRMFGSILLQEKVDKRWSVQGNALPVGLNLVHKILYWLQSCLKIKRPNPKTHNCKQYWKKKRNWKTYSINSLCINFQSQALQQEKIHKQKIWSQTNTDTQHTYLAAINKWIEWNKFHTTDLFLSYKKSSINTSLNNFVCIMLCCLAICSSVE